MKKDKFWTELGVMYGLMCTMSLLVFFSVRHGKTDSLESAETEPGAVLDTQTEILSSNEESTESVTIEEYIEPKVTAGIVSYLDGLHYYVPVEVEDNEDAIITEHSYMDEELELLAHLIYAENGADYIDDIVLYWTGSVVLNRMASEYYPDTMYEVIYQKGQYACVELGTINNEPSDRCYEIAEDLLIDGSILPEDVLYQAEFKQGSKTYAYIQGAYFCYY